MNRSGLNDAISGGNEERCIRAHRVNRVLFVIHCSDEQQFYPSDPKQHNCSLLSPQNGDKANSFKRGVFRLSHFFLQLTNQPNKQTIKKQTNKPTNQPNNKPTNQQTSQPNNKPINQPTNQTTNQSTNQPNNQPINQTTIQLTDCVTNKQND